MEEETKAAEEEAKIAAPPPVEPEEKIVDTPPPKPELVLDFNFVPTWARKPPQEVNFYVAPGRRDRDRDYSSDDRGRGRPDRKGPPSSRGTRPPDRGARGDGRRDDRRGRSGRGRDDRRDDRRGDERPRDDRFLRRPEYVARAPVQVRFVPEQKRLSAVVRQIHLSKKSYPLVELASLFLSKPETCEVRIEMNVDSNAHLYQCKTCRVVALDHSLLAAHVLKDHLSEYFTIEEKLSDPPTGQFVCVAKCGLSGVLLGPPNHHSYSERIHELHHTRYPEMSLEEYKNRIQMVHEPALIEQWKEESRKQTVYHRKMAGGEAGPALKLAEAEALVAEEIAPTVIQETRRATLPATVARTIEDRSLLQAVREAWQKENRFPLTLTIAFRGAFRHRRLDIFKAGKGIDFVSSVPPAPLDPEHTVEPIREVLTYLREHPGCTRQNLIEALRPGLAPDAPEIKSVVTPLAWLVERGHIIEFFNGTLSVPLRGRPPEPSREKKTSAPPETRP